MNSKALPNRPAARLLARQYSAATHLQLARIVFLLLSRLLVRLPRNITPPNNLLNEQPRHYLTRVAAIQRDNAVRGASLTDPMMVSASPSSPSSAAGAQAPVIPATPGTLGPCPLHGSINRPPSPHHPQQHVAPAARSPPPHTTTAGFSVVVNIAGPGTIVNTDDLVQTMGRQARAWQVRNKDLLRQARREGRHDALQNNFVINVTASDCVVGGAATVKQALAGRKRRREDGDVQGHRNVKDEAEQPASRRHRAA